MRKLMAWLQGQFFFVALAILLYVLIDTPQSKKIIGISFLVFMFYHTLTSLFFHLSKKGVFIGKLYGITALLRLLFLGVLMLFFLYKEWTSVLDLTPPLLAYGMSLILEIKDLKFRITPPKKLQKRKKSARMP